MLTWTTCLPGFAHCKVTFLCLSKDFVKREKRNQQWCYTSGERECPKSREVGKDGGREKKGREVKKRGRGKGKEQGKPGNPIGVYYHLSLFTFSWDPNCWGFFKDLILRWDFTKCILYKTSILTENEPPTDSAVGLPCYFKNYTHQICQEEKENNFQTDLDVEVLESNFHSRWNDLDWHLYTLCANVKMITSDKEATITLETEKLWELGFYL